ncbi:MAG: hypothetical protein M0011_03790 [Elusimicrobia bacterium]|nr:hypothetical protein [Elusimicrobiota bacterium]
MKKILTILILVSAAGLARAGDLESAASAAALTDLRLERAADMKVPEPSAAAALGEMDKTAPSELLGLPGATSYEKVKALFERGVPATQADLTGIKAGRTFTAAGTVAKGAMIGMVVKVSEYEAAGATDEGPLFGSSGKERFAIGFIENDIEYYNKRALKGLEHLFQYPYYYSFAFGVRRHPESPQRNYMIFPEARAVMNWNNGIQQIIEERKAGEYLVEKFTEKDTASGRILKTLYTYYFMDLTPRD